MLKKRLNQNILSGTGQQSSRWKATWVGAAFVWAISQPTAHAYIDGGSGSLVLQALVAGVGGLLMLSRQWLRRLFGKKKKEKTEVPPDHVDP